MKTLQAIQVSTPLQDGYQLFALSDKWAELLPKKVPLRFSFFRYLGFYVVETKDGKSNVVTSKKLVTGIHVTIHNDLKVVFSERIHTSFHNGGYYVENIKLDSPGAHKITVLVEGKIGNCVQPLVLNTRVFEFMDLDECEDLQVGLYAPLRHFVLECEKRGNEDKLRQETFITSFLRKKTSNVRLVDAKWWLRAYVEHTLDRPERKTLLQKLGTSGGRSKHKRKSEQPARSADKKETDNLFDRRPREWKRVRSGEIRIFTNEPLYAHTTLTVFSRRDLYHQLSLYSQV